MYQECTDQREISYLNFEKKEEKYLKNRVENKHHRTTRVKKKKKVCDIVNHSLSAYCSHVKKISETLQQVREAFTG